MELAGYPCATLLQARQQGLMVGDLGGWPAHGVVGWLQDQSPLPPVGYANEQLLQEMKVVSYPRVTVLQAGERS